MSTFEFEVSGQRYRASRMPAAKQWHVIRRLSPLVGAIGALTSLANTNAAEHAATRDQGDNTVAGDQERPTLDLKSPSSISALEIAGKALASLSDEDSDFVTSACLSLCERQTDNGSWAKIWNAQANSAQFQNINLRDMLQIVFAVLKESLSDFFPDLRSMLNGDQQGSSMKA